MSKLAESSHTQQIEPGVEQVIACPVAEKVDPRVKRTRGLIEDAFRTLIHTKGYADISVGDIAEMATVNRATFYAHFEDKSHLAQSVLREDFHRAILEGIRPGRAATIDSLTDLGAATFQFLGRVRGQCPKGAKDLEVHLGPTLIASLQETLAYWLEADPGFADRFPGIDRTALVTVLSWSLYGGAVQWTQTAKRPAPDRAARRIVTLILGRIE